MSDNDHFEQATDMDSHPVDRAPTQADDFRRQRVIDAAMQVFLSYGYKRATMDDIARTADMSRPALYLHFKNKTDIFRAVADHMFELALESTSLSLAQNGSLADRINGAIDTVMINLICQINSSAHGEELLDLKNSLAADLVAGWHNAVAAMFRDTIAADARQRGIDLSARGLTAATLAEMLMDGLEGMKRRVSDADSQRKAARQLVRIVELAIA